MVVIIIPEPVFDKKFKDFIQRLDLWNKVMEHRDAESVVKVVQEELEAFAKQLKNAEKESN